MRIYWIENGKRCGPATAPDVISKIQLQELTPDTLGWHAGCQGWAPLRELPALADFLHEETPEEAAPAEPTPDAEPAAEDNAAPDAAATANAEKGAELLRRLLPGPLMRLLARALDMSLYMVLAMCIMYYCHAPFKEYFLPSHPLFWLPMPALEALLLYVFHTTPGKYWLGINLNSIQNGWSYGRLLLRSVLVWGMGMGCMIMPVSLVTMAFSYYILTRRGITLWDIRTSTLPILNRRPSVLSIISLAFMVYICSTLSSQYMLPWMPELLEHIRTYAPDMAQMLEQMLQNAHAL